MFDIFFGWRKASKCKKLIRRVQCRLKLLKNKRCSIMKMLREDIAELLRHGHEQTAFDRVELLYKDETTVAIYDILENFCEFIIINFPYIRKHKDFPNDINEAVSSLIYASARFGDLPELILIRKLFGERYGQRFATVALELLPGNLVNRQMKEKLCIQSVSDDVKFKLVDEIARSCFQSGPLLIEYSPLLANNSTADQILSIDYVINPDRNENDKEQVNSSIVKSEAKVLYVDFSSEHNKFIKDPGHSCKESITSVPSSCFSTTSQAASNTGDSSVHDNPGQIIKFADLDYTVSGPKRSGNSASTKTHTTGFRRGDRDLNVSSSSESSDKLPKEMIYLDDIEEFESPVSKEGNFQDQRLFMFKSAISPQSEKVYIGDNKSFKEQSESKDEKRGSRGFRSRRKMSGKRLRKRSISLEKRCIADEECAIYYGQSCESSPNCNHKSHHRRKHHKKVAIKEKNRSDCTRGSTDIHPRFVNVSSSFTFVGCTHDPLNSNCRCSFSGKKVRNCSLQDPCYFCTDDETDELKYPTLLTMTENATLKRLSAPILCQKIVKHGSCYYKEPDIHETTQKTKGNQDSRLVSDNLVSSGYLSRKVKKHFDEEGVAGRWENDARCDPVIFTCSTISNSSTIKEVQPPCMRATTMPPERLKDNSTDNILRSNSFPVQQPSHLQNGTISNRHVHPKLPDYDDLAAKFSALKKAYLQSK